MAQLKTFVSGFALSLAASTVLLGCGSGSGDGASPPPLGYGGAAGGSAVPSGGAAATGVAQGGAPASPGATSIPTSQGGPPAVTPPPSVGGAPVTGGAGAPAIGGGGVPASGGGTPGVAGAGTAGGGAPATTGTWTPTGNLDANGKLIAPAPADGFQIVTTTFTLNPGQEVFNCFHAQTPNTATFPVGEWDAQMSAGSHHFILYRADGDTTAANTLVNFGCTAGFGGSTWLYTQGSPRSHLLFPDGVAMELTAGERVTFDMHYINTGTDMIHAQIALNVNHVKSAMYQKADAQVSFNTQIAIPPNGMQTVGGDCPPVAGASYFIMQTHTHKRGILAVINRKLASGMLGEELVRTTNWDNPQAHVWQSAPFLTFQQGESFHYSCTYQNDRASLVTVGTSAENNEMCMAEAYFFPASGKVPGCS